MQELWKPILGYENEYHISNFGNVKSLQRVFTRKDGKKLTIKEKILTPSMDKKGYPRITLCNINKKQITPKVHRLVAEHFIENPNNYTQVNHIDGNKQNNNITNLEWCTVLQNNVHAKENNLLNALKGEQHKMSKLNEKDIIIIRDLRKSGILLKDICKLFNVNERTISSICLNKSWKHL